MTRFTQLQEIKLHKLAVTSLILLSLLFAVPAFTQTTTNAPADKNFFTQQYLLGDWGGARTKLAEEKGVTFDFFYVGDFLADPQGVKTGAAGWNRVRGTMDIDFGKLANVKGLTFHVTGLWQGGPNLGSSYLGSISNPSGLVSARTEILDSYWLQYAMADGKVALRAGQFASMDLYGLQYYGGNYVMEPLDYGFNNRFNDYASFDPASGPGVQLQITPARFVYFKAAFTSGNRNPYAQDPNGFHFLKKDSGVFSDEIGFLTDQPGGKVSKEKYYPGFYAFGSTYNGGKFSDPFNNTPLYLSPYTGNYVIYFMANQAIFRPKAGSNTGLDAHFGISASPNQTYNFVDKNITGGLIYNGLIPSRPKDALAFGLSYSHVSNAYSTAYADSLLGAPVLGSEKA